MTPAQRFASVAGGGYILVGIVGFLLGPDILGIFGVNAAHNVVHLGLGVAWLWVFPDRTATRAVNLVAGVALLVLAGLGTAGFLDVDGLVNLNVASGAGDASNWLHAGTGAAALGLEIRPGGRSRDRRRP